MKIKFLDFCSKTITIFDLTICLTQAFLSFLTNVLVLLKKMNTRKRLYKAFEKDIEELIENTKRVQREFPDVFAPLVGDKKLYIDDYHEQMKENIEIEQRAEQLLRFWKKHSNKMIEFERWYHILNEKNTLLLNYIDKGKNKRVKKTKTQQVKPKQQTPPKKQEQEEQGNNAWCIIS
jgi:DNA integrity scanning protein DisA with diadenylate cyclase activity